MPIVRLPADQVMSGAAVPPLCPRHGLPALTMKKNLRFVSAPPAWAYIFAITLVVFAVIVMRNRHDVVAPNWPWCAGCRRSRVHRLLVGAGLPIVPILILAANVTVPPGSSAAHALAIFMFACFIGGFIVLTRCRAVAIAGGRVSKDGRWLEVRPTHEDTTGASQLTPTQLTNHTPIPRG
ncbi:hypothetical protein OHA72_49450 [Dactylosporangium sp. NBC_01737]|uniref:hypothetical protein n=1 Tax=Dactylosporangium sp. NBC_01737 TaxID=2975959 RepID=UPI002E0F7889|nr:hypothetical protein OHA72_49450 [Dactylosporangium sp. NBC_01737]